MAQNMVPDLYNRVCFALANFAYGFNEMGI